MKKFALFFLVFFVWGFPPQRQIAKMASAALKVIEKELAEKDAEIQRVRKEIALLREEIAKKDEVFEEHVRLSDLRAKMDEQVIEDAKKGEKFYKDWVDELLPPDSAAQRAFHNSDVRGLLLGRFSLGRRGEPGAGEKRWVDGWLHDEGVWEKERNHYLGRALEAIKEKVEEDMGFPSHHWRGMPDEPEVIQWFCDIWDKLDEVIHRCVLLDMITCASSLTPLSRRHFH